MASQASFSNRKNYTYPKHILLVALTAFLNILQPLGRLWGRLQSGLRPWRRPQRPTLKLLGLKNLKFWSELWQEPEKRLKFIEESLRARKSVVLRGGDYDPWDLEVRGGLFGSIRICMAVEDHGSGAQLIRFRIRPKFSYLTLPLILLAVALSVMPAVDQAWVASISLAIAAFVLIVTTFLDYTAAATSFYFALQQSGYVEEQ